MSNSSLSVRILPETERGVAYTVIAGAGYVKVGTPLNFAAIEVIFQNQTDATLSFSWDGTNSAISLAPGSIYCFDVQAVKGRSDCMAIAQATQFWVKQTTGTAPSVGFAFISAFYGANFNNL